MSAEQLLEVQRLDTEGDQLRHRRATLSERDLLAAAVEERAEVQRELDELNAVRLEVLARQKRFEDEAQTVADRAAKDEGRLYGGEVSAMKDLQALQDEIAGLRSRQGELEDRALEAMEEAEESAARVAALEERIAAVDERIGALEADLAAAEAEIDSRLNEVAEARDEAAGAVDPEVLADYEKLRPGFGAATVVRFTGGNCEGCPSTMPAVEADRIKHAEPGSVLSCQECGRIVLR